MVDIATPTPQVNDGYWFSYSKILIDGALKSRDDAADKLQTFVGWLWTVYTAGAVVGAALGKLSVSATQNVFIGLPIVFLIIAYLSCIRVRIPVITGFDPRIPDSIAAAYKHNLLLKQQRLLSALFFTAASGLLVAIAIATTSTATSGVSAPQVTANVVEVTSGRTLLVTGALPSVANPVLSVTDGKGVLLHQEQLSLNQGVFIATPFPIGASAPKVLVLDIRGALKDGAQLSVVRQISVVDSGK